MKTNEIEGGLTQDLYEIDFFGEPIDTIVTNNPVMVDSWISEIERIHHRRLSYLRVGLDIEWRPSFKRGVTNPAATLQLCVGHKCLIFQLIHAPSIPPSLVNFLWNENYTFVGVGIKGDKKKLREDYQLIVRNVSDLAQSAGRFGRVKLKNASLKVLVKEVLKKDLSKPDNVRKGRWDNRRLTAEQVKYACIDSFVSFQIGRIFRTGDMFLDFYCGA